MRLIAEWQSTIAHPDFADWITVAAYLVAAWLSFSAAKHAAVPQRARERKFWQAVAILLGLLAINELLDLQTLLTVVARAHAKAHGWYEGRRDLQYAFVIALGGVGLLGSILLWWFTRRMPATVRVALAGIVFIGLFVMLRASSFNHLEELLGRGPTHFNWGSVQEMLGIVIVAAAAALYTRGPPADA